MHNVTANGCGLTSHFGELKIRLLFYGIIILKVWFLLYLFIHLFIYLFIIIIINNLFIHLLFVSLFVFFVLSRARYPSSDLVTCVHHLLFLLALYIF